MKTCPSCGGEFQDRFLYCVRDGTRLEPIAPESVAEIVPAKKTGPVAGVLYCPACSGEYPLTFSACPLDSLPLTREKPSANLQQVFALEVPEAHSIKTLPVAPEIEVAVQQTALAERPDTGSYQVARITDSIAVEAVAIPETADLSDEPDELPDTDYLGDGDEDLEDGNELSGDADEEPRGLRMAAIILSSALILLVLGGLYMFISIAARAPMSSAITAVESKASAAPGPVFVPT
ncbi:MAG TPA: hypothetical protein VNO70_11130, partial [Blastocatellia bacterium]|nr:hypothetical protein [Blastocatellia bacterium]